MSAATIRASIAHYVVEDIDLTELEGSLPDGWDLDLENDPEVRRLLLRVMGFIAEVRNGRRRESTLRKQLADLVEWATEVPAIISTQPTITLRTESTVTSWSVAGRIAPQAAPA